MDLSPGSTFAGYAVRRRLGRGGMGQVYLVDNAALDRQEALKVISTGAGTGTEFAERFAREAKTAAALDHPNIITVYHYGIEDGSPWFTMGYIDGPDLTAARVSTDEAVEVITQAAAALDYAHAKGVIHRDIKPANVLLTRDSGGRLDRVIVLDFGIAKLATSSQLTATNTFIGTVAYTAPEVISSQPATPASDQYSLACTAYRLLAGTDAFDAPSTAALMAACLYQQPPPISAARPDLVRLDPVLQRALAKDPAQRFPSCRDFAAALAAALRAPASAPLRPAPVPPPVLPPPVPQPHGTAAYPAGFVPGGGYPGPQSHPAAAHPSSGGYPVNPAVPPQRSSKTPLILALVALLIALGAAGGVAYWKLASDDDANSGQRSTGSGVTTTAPTPETPATTGGTTATPRTTTTTTTTSRATVSVSGADWQGFTSEPPRCNSTDPAVFIGRTNRSNVIICHVDGYPDRLYYKGYADGNSSPSIDVSSTTSTAYTATANDGTQYIVSSSSLVIKDRAGQTLATESMRQYWID